MGGTGGVAIASHRNRNTTLVGDTIRAITGRHTKKSPGLQNPSPLSTNNALRWNDAFGTIAWLAFRENSIITGQVTNPFSLVQIHFNQVGYEGHLGGGGNRNLIGTFQKVEGGGEPVLFCRVPE